MPVARYFTVTQTREIQVSANDLGEALGVADAYFNDKPKPDLKWARITSEVREVELVGRESSR
jgi:hypothetical protein